MTDDDQTQYVEESKIAAEGVRRLIDSLTKRGLGSHAVCSGLLATGVQYLVTHDGVENTATWLRDVAAHLEATPERRLDS